MSAAAESAISGATRVSDRIVTAQGHVDRARDDQAALTAAPTLIYAVRDFSSPGIETVIMTQAESAPRQGSLIASGIALLRECVVFLQSFVGSRIEGRIRGAWQSKSS